MNGRPRLRAPGQCGFSLVELLVGILIAMLGVLVMMQALLNFEERGRTTGDGNEALSNGAVMLHVLSRDLQQAGYGLNSLSLLGCQLRVPTGATLTIAPAQINPGAGVLPAQDADTDALLVMSKGLESVGGVDGLVKIPGIAQTPAGMDRRIVSVEDGVLLNYGPRTDQVLASVVEQLYGEGGAR